MSYFVLSIPITQVYNSLNIAFVHVNLNGVSMSQFTANTFALWGAAIVLGIFSVIILFFMAIHSQENDTYEY